MNASHTRTACPNPDSGSSDQIALAHGEGGRLTRQLIQERILPVVGNDVLATLGDASVLPQVDGPLAFTTDSYVVSPLVFPGGDIGSLAVYGTVNDLAVAGARPLWISLALIIEEGFSSRLLEQILESVAAAVARVGVKVATGDTKVVPRGAVDGLFVNTTGIGELLSPAPPGPSAIETGDVLLVSGPIGRHGMAIMASREGLEFDDPPVSDSAPLVDAVEALRGAGIPVRALRDATRGGVAAVLHEWASACGLTLALDEQSLPVTPDVRGACELLGLEAVHVACEGTMVVTVPADSAASALDALRAVPETRNAEQIGEVQPRSLAPVVIRRALQKILPLDEPLGAPLPRIC